MTESLRERVLKQLRAEIIAGECPPGMIYSVPSLAAELEISTTPVREALLELSNSGLVEPVRNKGFRVTRPTLQDLRDIFHLRDLLEIDAARLMLATGQADLELLHHHAEEIERAVEAGDVNAYLLHDRAFHGAMFTASGNALMAQMAMSLRDRMRLFGIRSASGLQRQRDSVPEHYRLVELIAAGDAEALVVLLRHHILSWEPVFTEAWVEESPRRKRLHAESDAS
ncbi:GntR family transcriptional regulator [Acidimangrovimonas sediminis]|uniref:GntR family transcriptional regulator n=1 Tax=Acidimangrovimonas sediminis TaxID=2056283 RepID=UPI000C7F96ED|nr:GntR family transcriptional regulator [Acidimangrovimonas sediminis]